MLRRSGLQPTLFDKGTRLGGRTSAFLPQHNGETLRFEHGTKFALCTDERFARLASSPVLQGILREWDDRLVVLGARAGSIISRDDLRSTGMFRRKHDGKGGDDGHNAESDAPMNFCGFLEGGSEEHTLWTGADGFGAVCEQMVSRAGVEVHQRTSLRTASWHGGQWTLSFSGDSVLSPADGFDTLVLANHDPGFAADVITSEVDTSADPELTHPEVRRVVDDFCSGLRGLRKTSRYALMLAFDRPLDEVGWDGAAVHGSGVLQFMARGMTTPTGVECWTAGSTAEFGGYIDQLARAGGMSPEEALEKATPLLLDAALESLGRREGARVRVVDPCFVQTRRWGNAFFDKTLDLGKHNQAVTFQQLGLAVCGDYLSDAQNVQAAALSGMCAADRVLQWAAHAR
eukprot:TRINITY_DN8101_c0_g1_i2.p1 TRINITY_DN8101_c0_g1~~TRINITY_DN8101_c0_g1_i2.p1  ORF type:complete len:402 (+),score=70.90 TRINITY_DN8101_c0_g1_i2:148-1353(+)